MKRKLTLLCLSLMAIGGTSFAQTVVTGPSSSRSPYVVPVVPGGKSVAIITAGDSVNGYRMAGTPDGLGAFDNGDGTFTVLMNHELQNAGSVRAHGQAGAFVSKWIINKSDLSVVSGADLMQNVKLWNTTTNSYETFNAANLPTPATRLQFGRFCSADLPKQSALYNAATGKGTQEHIFFDGEETGNEGRGMAHIVTGTEAGTSYEVPRLGKFSWENALANPATGDVTVVAGTDDATPGQVYFYIGTKTNTGNTIEKAGLTNGNLWSVAVNGLLVETSAGIPAPGTAFTMVNLGNVENMTGATLQTNSTNAGVTQFLRPEDGAWDPSHPEDFYFATTNSFTSPSRLWKLHFSNINDLTQGGTITAVLDGTEGQKMLDNIGFDKFGNIVIVEDVGANAHVGKTWNYNVNTDAFTQIYTHDSTRFVTGGSQFLTIDEEASGIIDVSDILGNGWWIGSDQAHYAQPNPMVEGGQFFAFFNPITECAGLSSDVTTTNGVICSGHPATLTAGTASQYMWSNGDTTRSITVTTPGSYSVTLMGANGCTLASDTVIIATIPTLPIISSASSICDGASAILSLNLAPGSIPTPSSPFTLATVWMNNGVAIVGSENSPVYQATTAGSYTLMVMDTVSGCSRTSSAKNITVKPTPVADFSYTGSTVFCQGQSLTLNADVQPGYTFRWLLDGTQVGTGPTYMAKVAGIYTVTAKLNGCADTSSTAVSVGVNALPAAMLTSADNDSFCSGSSVTLDAAPSGGSYQYEFIRGSVSMGASASSSMTATDGGNYKVKVTDLNTGCAAVSAPYRVYSIATPVAHATAVGNNINLNNGPVTLRANYSPTITYQWTRNGVDIAGADMREFMPTQTGTYRVITTRGGLCSTTSDPVPVISTAPAREAAVTTTGFEFTGYPNPVNSQLTVTVNGLDVVNGQVRVLDMSGRVVLIATVTAAQSAIDMSSLANGLYIVTFNDASGNKATLKVTKQ